MRSEGELSLRAKNLVWTVSGNHALKLEISETSLGKNRERCLYEALKLGGAEKLLGLEEVMLYSMKKGFLGADEQLVQSLVSLCLDCAVYSRVCSERPGAAGLRRDAYEAAIDHEFARLASTPLGVLEYAHMARALGIGAPVPRAVQPYAALLESLDGGGTAEILSAADRIYNEYLDRAFLKKGLTLEQVLAVTVQEMIEEGYLQSPDKSVYLSDMLNRAARAEQEADGRSDGISTEAVELDEAQLEKMAQYTEQVFGRSALTQAENLQMQRACCVGLHDGRSVHLTEGLLAGEPVNSIYYKLADKHRHHNEMAYYDAHRVIKQNIHRLADLLRRSLIRRTEPELVGSSYGAIRPNRLWRVGRVRDPRLFVRRIESDSAGFVVDVLVDGSGSQSRRQGEVAAQAYILSAALSLAGIPHRVASYCTFFDSTVLHRFRNYDDPPEADWRVFQYTAKAANRDGLAVRAAVQALKERQEQNKILIVLSDGKPNDVSISKGRARMQTPYVGAAAVDDTAREIRQVRAGGVAVLGVFSGDESDLDAERRIFGKDFAYIRTLATFSHVVGNYLNKCIDEM